MADRKQMKADRDEYENFARDALGLSKSPTGGPKDSSPQLGPTKSYIGSHATVRDQRDITARQLSGKHPGIEATKIAPRDPRDNTARQLSGKHEKK